MWHDDGLVICSCEKIVKGPNLAALIGSNVIYLGKGTHQLDFTRDRMDSIHHNYPLKLCVASIRDLGGERVDLELRDRYNEGGFYRLLGYNHVKRKGTLEELREERNPIEYLPVMRTPDLDGMMALNDTGFVMVYALHMTTYRLPVRCEYRGCEFVIRCPSDLRKHSGRCLCPVHFPVEIDEYAAKYGESKVGDYLRRAATLLPREPMQESVWKDKRFETE